MDSRDECDVGSHGSRTGLLDPDVEAGRRDGERHRAIREQAAASTQSLADTLAGSAGRAPVGRVAGIDGWQDPAKSRWPVRSRRAPWLLLASPFRLELNKDGTMNSRTPSQEYLNKVSPMGNALTKEQSDCLRDLLISEGRIGNALGSFEDFMKNLESEVDMRMIPHPQRQEPDGAIINM